MSIIEIKSATLLILELKELLTHGEFNKHNVVKVKNKKPIWIIKTKEHREKFYSFGLMEL